MTRYFVLLNFLLLTSIVCHAQQSVTHEEPLKVAVVAPLYLDSAFSGGVLKGSLPKIMTPGLDFIQGAEIALDTISTKGRKIEAHFIDSKSSARSIEWWMKSGGLDRMDLIIGSVKEPEYRELSLFALQKRIPFVSATYPNDGAIRNDSFLIIMNSTLKTHVEGIYSFIVQKHGMDQILLLKRRNDNRIDNYFKEVNNATGKPLLNIKSIAVDSISSSQLALLIDTLKPAVVIGATLDEWSALNYADACYPFRSKVTFIGMPNWDGFRELFNKDRYKDFPILFTTPHSDENQNAFTDYLGNQYFTKYRTKPTDMAYKGFESVYYFTNVLLNYPDSFMEHLNEDQFACFHEFNFRPLILNNHGVTDYFENKHVFIIQILNGMISKFW